tara:strand:- start:545 stop:652 length:108 start_codon:yes stop_codon:yes gene_type:complete
VEESVEAAHVQEVLLDVEVLLGLLVPQDMEVVDLF